MFLICRYGMWFTLKGEHSVLYGEMVTKQNSPCNRRFGTAPLTYVGDLRL